jgi:hypothetical protein
MLFWLAQAGMLKYDQNELHPAHQIGDTFGELLQLMYSYGLHGLYAYTTYIKAGR